MRGVLAIIIGLLVAVIVVALIEMLGHFVYPPPENLDLSQPEVFKAMIDSLPMASFLFVLMAWFAGTFVGAKISLWIARSQRFIFAAIITVSVLAAAIATTISIPHPFWFMATAIIGIPISGWFAWRTGQ